VYADRLALFAERGRQLAASDPYGRLLTISCGAALHDARVTLAAKGWGVHVIRLPEPNEPGLLARLVVSGRTPATTEAASLAQAIPVRHTDRRPVSDEPMPAATLASILAAANAGARLHALTAANLARPSAAHSGSEVSHPHDQRQMRTSAPPGNSHTWLVAGDNIAQALQAVGCVNPNWLRRDGLIRPRHWAPVTVSR
jgi:hypothetical protein